MAPSAFRPFRPVGTYSLNAMTEKQPSLRPSLGSLIQNDQFAQFSFMIILVTWGLYLAIGVFGLSFTRRGNQIGPEDGAGFLVMAVVATIVGAAVLVWRVRALNTLFSRAREVQGQITGIGFKRGSSQGRVEYAYSVDGQSYTGSNLISQTNKSRALQPGDEVVLLVDSTNPGNALIRDLYQ